MKKFIHLLFLRKKLIQIIFLFGFSLSANFSFAQSTYNCNNCTSNDISIKKVELVSSTPNGLGGYLPLATTCLSGTPIDAFIKVTLDQNATTRYGTQIEADVFVDGLFQQHIRYESCATTSSGVFFIYLPNSPSTIQWTCGEILSLRNIIIGWGHSVSTNVCNVGDCEIGPKCFKYDLNTNLIVITPIKPDFTFVGSCPPNNSAQTYTFTSTSSGGVLPYTSYSWNITKNGVPIIGSPFSGNPLTIDFSNLGGAGNYNVVLTLTDSNTPPTTASSLSKLITVSSCCVTAATCKLTDINTEGCIIPSPITDPAIVFNYNACGKSVTMTHNDSGDTMVCSDGNGANFTRTYTLLFDGIPFATCSQNITIQDTTDPIISVQAQDLTVQCDGNGNISDLNNWLAANGGASASDVCSSVTWSNDFSAVSDGCGASGSVTVTFTATDDCGNDTITSATFTIQDTTDPIISVQAQDLTVQCDGNGNISDLNNWLASNGGASASDVCSSVTWSNDFSSVSDGCGASGSVTVTFTATDDCGNDTTTSATFTIQDTTDPIFTSELPNDITVSCDNIPDPIEIEASDNCDSDVNISVNDVINQSEGNCAGNFSISRTWTITDDCGNSNSYTQTITVYDTAPPTLVTPLDEELSVSCSNVPGIPNLEFEDNCSGIANVEYSETTTTISIYEYVIVREWVVSDNCGNSDTFVQTINVTVEDPFDAIPYSICTQEEAIDLFTILGSSIPTNGEWVDLSETGGLNGSIFNPLNVPVGYYTLQYIVTTEDNNCPMIFEVYLNINEDCIVLPACDVVVYNAVSPNNDGLNDFFFIDGIDCYPNNTVEIYNKWGILIYETRGYDNGLKSFRGQSEGRSTLNKNEGVPDGTYYYILKYVDEENKTHDKAGYLYVSK